MGARHLCIIVVIDFEFKALYTNPVIDWQKWLKGMMQGVDKYAHTIQVLNLKHKCNFK